MLPRARYNMCSSIGEKLITIRFFQLECEFHYDRIGLNKSLKVAILSTSELFQNVSEAFQNYSNVQAGKQNLRSAHRCWHSINERDLGQGANVITLAPYWTRFFFSFFFFVVGLIVLTYGYPINISGVNLIMAVDRSDIAKLAELARIAISENTAEIGRAHV